MKNYYIVNGDTTAIRVIQRNGKEHWVLIDTADLGIMPKNSICVHWNKCTKSFYALYRDGKTVQKLHRLIMGFPEGLQIDHDNHDTLDERRKNLKAVTHQVNKFNRHCKGYYWNKARQKWLAQIKLNGKSIYLGYFTHEQDAENWYLLAKEIIHVNF